MATDVQLDQGDGSFVVVQGRVLKVAGSDLVLDSTERRRDALNTSRRALVHDVQDGLTINFNGDYPGGVTVVGHVVVTGDLTVAGTDVKSELGLLERTSSSRIDLLETTVASLVELMGAVVIPPWTTKTQVEQGDDEVALGGGPAMLAAEALGLVVNFEFDRQVPGFQHEDVMSVRPPPGSAVKRGSSVTIAVNLEG